MLWQVKMKMKRDKRGETTWRCHENAFIGALGIQQPVILCEPFISWVNQWQLINLLFILFVWRDYLRNELWLTRDLHFGLVQLWERQLIILTFILFFISCLDFLGVEGHSLFTLKINPRTANSWRGLSRISCNSSVYLSVSVYKSKREKIYERIIIWLFIKQAQRYRSIQSVSTFQEFIFYLSFLLLFSIL